MRTVVMLAFYFPPCTAYPTAAERSHGFASWAAEFGWRPIVVAPAVGSICSCEGCMRGEHELSGTYEVVRIPVRGPGTFARDHSSARSLPRAEYPITALKTLGRKSLTAGHLLRASVGRLDPFTDWPTAAVKATEGIIRAREVDAIWATASPFGSLWAADVLARRFGLPWIADLRDPLRERWVVSHYRDLALLARVRRILKRPAYVVEAYPCCAEQDQRWLNRSCEAICSGFDPRKWLDVKPAVSTPVGETLNLVYTGLLSPGWRTLEPALHGLRRFRERNPDAPIRLNYYGRSEELVRRDAARYGVEELVECRGFVSPEEIRARLRAADLLLLSTSTTLTTGQAGGKLYEYLAARRPILAVPAANEFVSAVLRETNTGISAATPDDVAGALERYLMEWRQHGSLTYRGDPEAVSRYAISDSARRLARLLDASVADRAPVPARAARRS